MAGSSSTCAAPTKLAWPRPSTELPRNSYPSGVCSLRTGPALRSSATGSSTENNGTPMLSLSGQESIDYRATANIARLWKWASLDTVPALSSLLRLLLATLLQHQVDGLRASDP